MTETPDLANPTRPAGFRLPLGRRGLVIAAMAIIGAGTALNWGWLTAIGAAPLILSLAPCAVMCATGYCVKTPTSEPVDTKDGISTRERN